MTPFPVPKESIHRPSSSEEFFFCRKSGGHRRKILVIDMVFLVGVHAKGVVLCERTCFCLLSTFKAPSIKRSLLRTLLRTLSLYQRPLQAPSKSPSKKHLLLENLLRTLLRSVRLHDPLGVHPTGFYRVFVTWETDFYTPPVLGGAAFCRFQRQRCIKILCPKGPDFYTPLALNTAKGQHLPALVVYKNQSPIVFVSTTGLESCL